MSEIKVSQMQEATNVNDDDYLMIVQNGINKKTKARNVGTGGNVAGDTLPVGSVIEWNSDIIPVNWLLCNGQEISRTDYADLFKILGTKYGQGDGSTTFNLPNRKGNVAVGKDENDEDFNELGKTGGEKEHTLTVAEMPSHNHEPTTNSAVMAKSGQNEMAQETTGGRTYELLTIGKTGGSQPHNNLQPYIVSNFIIKAKQSAGLVATVVDNLESESETDALSAKQGKVLYDKFSKNIITAKGNSSGDTLAPADGAKIELENAISVGTKLTLENGGVKIGANIKKIMLSATTTFTSGQASRYSLEIYKNNNSLENRIARTILNNGSGVDSQTTINIIPQIIDNIAEGDILYVYVSTSIEKSASNPLTMLTVEVIE